MNKRKKTVTDYLFDAYFVAGVGFVIAMLIYSACQV